MMPVNAWDSAGTSREKQGQSRDKAGTNRDKQGQAGTFPFCPCLSLLVPVHPCLAMLVPACPCLSLSVPVCPCLSMSVNVCLYICYTLMSTPADEYKVFISMTLVKLTFLSKVTVPIHANHVFTNSAPLGMNLLVIL